MIQPILKYLYNNNPLVILKNKNLKKDQAALINIIFYEITAKMYRIFFGPNR